MIFRLLLLLIFLPTAHCLAGWEQIAAKVQLSGYGETFHAARIRNLHEMNSSRTGVRLEAAAEFGPAYLFISGDGEKNWKLADESGFSLHEAWFDYVGDGWDMRLGRQIIIWGKADGVQITDLVSPPDYTEYITRDLDEIRLPVTAAKFRLLGDVAVTEFIWIPFFKAAVLADSENPWQQVDRAALWHEAVEEPDDSLASGEFATRMSLYVSGLDLAFSAFYTWDDFATWHRHVGERDGSDELYYTPRHHRLTVFGAEFSRPQGDFVFRGEAAALLGRYFEVKNSDHNPVKRNLFNWLLGYDWTPGNQWTLMTQISGSSVNNAEPLLRDRHTLLLTLNIKKKLLRETVTLSNMLYYSVNDKGVLDRAQMQYEVSDGVVFYLGLDLFDGVSGTFNTYRGNSQLWCKLRYSF